MRAQQIADSMAEQEEEFPTTLPDQEQEPAPAAHVAPHEVVTVNHFLEVSSHSGN